MSVDRRKTIYWILTLLVMVPTAGSGFPELFGSGLEEAVVAYKTF